MMYIGVHNLQLNRLLTSIPPLLLLVPLLSLLLPTVGGLLDSGPPPASVGIGLAGLLPLLRNHL